MPSLGDIIAAANQKYGLPAGYLNTVAQIESSGNPNATNGGAKGLYQFIPSTAAAYGLSNPFDPVAASDAAGRLSKANADYLTAQLGHAPTAEQLYLAHQQGSGGAAKLLSNPNAPAAAVVGASAVTNNGGGAGMTGGQFASLWGQKFDRKAGLPFFAATANLGTQEAGVPGGAHVASAGSAPEGVYANAPSSTGQGDGGVALAAALAAPSAQDQQAAGLASLYAQQTAAQQQAAQVQRAALLSSGKIAATQQIG